MLVEEDLAVDTREEEETAEGKGKGLSSPTLFSSSSEYLVPRHTTPPCRDTCAMERSMV